MNLKKLLSSLAIGLLLVLQTPLAVLADAATPPADNTAPTTTTTDPSASPTTPPPASDTTTPPTDSSTPPASNTTPAPTDTNAGGPTTNPTPPAPTPPTTGPTTPTGPQQPTGPGQPTGVVPDYAYNDATHHWEPTITSSFTWNPATGYWESPFYNYDHVTGWYHVKPNVTPSSAINALTAGSGDPAGTLQQILGTSDPANSKTGPNSVNNASLNNNNQAILNMLAQAQIDNNNTQTAGSGAANVTGNTTGGSATTGAATVVSNLLNLLNSMWTWSSGGLNYFVQNFMGNHTGDINLNPTSVNGGGGSVGNLPLCAGGLTTNSDTGPNSLNNANANCQTNVTVNNRSSGAINNNLNLNAQSGAANVSGNTNGGSATSGDATAELNIMNLINSAIGAGQSFFGMINVFGNLNGDILFPQGFLDNAIASSAPTTVSPSGGASNSTTGPNSQNNANINNSNNLTVNNNPSAAFNNDINATATSGNANVANNTQAGSATTGNAKSSANTFNLFDTSVFGDNAVLVLVNVMGHWLGQIMNLGGSGGGSSAALLTGNATATNINTGPNSQSNSSVNNTNNLTLNNSATGTINNHITAGAQSGDASVTDNTKAGSAITGAAKVVSNVANFFGSTLNLKKWFGILVINVFGDWTGDVNKDTAAGNVPDPGPTVHTSTQTGSGQPAVLAHSASGSGATTGASSNASGQTISPLAAAATDSTKIAGVKLADHAQQAATTHSTGLLFILTAAFLLLAAGLFSLDSKSKKKRHKQE